MRVVDRTVVVDMDDLIVADAVLHLMIEEDIVADAIVAIAEARLHTQEDAVAAIVLDLGLVRDMIEDRQDHLRLHTEEREDPHAMIIHLDLKPIYNLKLCKSHNLK